MPLNDITRLKMQRLLETYGSSDSYFSRSGGLDNADSYKGLTIAARSFKKPTDSPAFSMMDEKEARALLVKGLDGAVEAEKDAGDFITSAYKVISFLSALKIVALSPKLSGTTKLAFHVDFPNGQALDRRFDVLLRPKKNGSGIRYTLDLVPI